LGFQPHHLFLRAANGHTTPLKARTLVSEIAGSESFVHLDFAGRRWVMLAHGIHDIEQDQTIEVHLDSRHLMAFDRTTGKALVAPPVAA
jgi:glycerol transport system ATP-binding protein